MEWSRRIFTRDCHRRWEFYAITRSAKGRADSACRSLFSEAITRVGLYGVQLGRQVPAMPLMTFCVKSANAVERLQPYWKWKKPFGKIAKTFTFIASPMAA